MKRIFGMSILTVTAMVLLVTGALWIRQQEQGSSSRSIERDGQPVLSMTVTPQHTRLGVRLGAFDSNEGLAPDMDAMPSPGSAFM